MIEKCVYVSFFMRKGQLITIFIHNLKGGYYCWVTLKDSCLSLLRTPITKCTLLRAMHLLRPIDRSFIRFSPIVLNLMRLRSRIRQSNPTKSTTSRGDWVFHCKRSVHNRNLPRRWSSYRNLLRRWFSYRNLPRRWCSTQNLPRHWRSRGSRFDKCINLNHSLNSRSTHIHKRRKVWFQEFSIPSFLSRSINHRSIGLWIHPRHLHL